MTTPTTERVLDAGDRHEVSELYARYAQAHDEGEPETFAALFTTDGVFDTGASSLTGRDALAEFVRKATGSGVRHLMSAVVVDAAPGGPQRATGSAYVQVVKIEDDVVRLVTMGRYVDEFAFEDGRWRFRVHRYIPFTGPALRGAPLVTAPA
jgi:uncharacterized protein (TIGR02246 family)